MKRRNFIMLTGLGLSAAALPLWYFKFRKFEYDPLLREPEFLSYIWDEDSIRQLGEAYRQQVPREKSEYRLASLLSKNLSSEQEITVGMREKVREDYKNGRTVMVDGWILSQTEARQCALFSLPLTDTHAH